MRIVVEELGTQFRLGLWGLCHNQQSAGIFVDTVYQSYAGVVGVVRGEVAQMPGNGIDQRTMEISHTWVNHHTRRFVNYHQLVILIDYLQRNILGFYLRIVVGTIQHQCHHIVRTHLVIALDGFAVHLYKTCVGSFLNAVAGTMGNVLRHIFVDAHRFLSTIYHHAQMLIELTIFFRCLVHQLNIVQFLV